MKKRVYIVVGIDIDIPEEITNEDIDDILINMDYEFIHPAIRCTEIVENQYNYQG